MPKHDTPHGPRQDAWFRISAGILIGFLILTLPMYASNILLRVILIVLYLTILFLVRIGKIRPRG